MRRVACLLLLLGALGLGPGCGSSPSPSPTPTPPRFSPSPDTGLKSGSPTQFPVGGPLSGTRRS